MLLCTYYHRRWCYVCEVFYDFLERGNNSTRSFEFFWRMTFFSLGKSRESRKGQRQFCCRFRPVQATARKALQPAALNPPAVVCMAKRRLSVSACVRVRAWVPVGERPVWEAPKQTSLGLVRPSRWRLEPGGGQPRKSTWQEMHFSFSGM